jgi:hypothetical protein
MSRRLLLAPLLLARNPIVISIHPHTRQFLKKKVASAHEVICEQYVLPSHLKEDDAASSLGELDVPTGLTSMV